MPPAEPPEAQPPEVVLGELFQRASRGVRQRWVAALAPWDLAPHQARALGIIGDHEPLRPGTLAEHLRVAPRSVTDVVDALVDRGLVEREPDPGDRRALVLRLTDRGRTVRDAVDASRRDETAGYFATLTDSDRAALVRILRRLDG